MELLGTFRQPPFAFTASYTHVRSREQVGGVIGDVAQTPRHSLGFVAMAENEDGRVGFELYYTGRQRLEANPYRDVSEPYTLVGGGHRQNLTDVRQHRWDPVLRPDRARDGRWTVDAWAPLDGRVINGGVRVQFHEPVYGLLDGAGMRRQRPADDVPRRDSGRARLGGAGAFAAALGIFERC